MLGATMEYVMPSQDVRIRGCKVVKAKRGKIGRAKRALVKAKIPSRPTRSMRRPMSGHRTMETSYVAPGWRKNTILLLYYTKIYSVTIRANNTQLDSKDMSTTIVYKSIYCTSN